MLISSYIICRKTKNAIWDVHKFHFFFSKIKNSEECTKGREDAVDFCAVSLLEIS
jgi:hypothetical protein